MDNRRLTQLEGATFCFPKLGPVILHSLIGSGTYGDVYYGIASDNGTKHAIKVFRNDETSSSLGGVCCTTLRELSALQRIGNHPNIVTMEDLIADYSVFSSDKSDCRIKTALLAAYEYCINGDLASILHDIRKNYSDKSDWGFPILEAKALAFQLLNGLAYIHSEKVSHRDLKPDNIMLQGHLLKLGDLGLCREIRLENDMLTRTVCSVNYRPLEVVLGPYTVNGDKVQFSLSYGLSVDIWSAACIISEMILGYPLFRANQEFELLVRIFRLLGTPTEDVWKGFTNYKNYPFKNTCDTIYFTERDIHKNLNQLFRGRLDVEGIDLVARMLKYSPRSRISAAEALSHPWFSDLAFNRLDGIGVCNWCYDVFRFRLGKELTDLIEKEDKWTLRRCVLVHLLCSNNQKNKYWSSAAESLDRALEYAQEKENRPVGTMDIPMTLLSEKSVEMNPALGNSLTAQLLGFVKSSIPIWNDEGNDVH